jgi:hypothetical protein
VFFHPDVREDEVFLDDGVDLFGLDETIEFFAPPSPGRVKQHPYGAAVASFAGGGGEERVSGVGAIQRGGGGR